MQTCLEITAPLVDLSTPAFMAILRDFADGISLPPEVVAWLEQELEDIRAFWLAILADD